MKMCGYINIIKQTFVYFVKEYEFSLRWQSINCLYFKIITACCFNYCWNKQLIKHWILKTILNLFSSNLESVIINCSSEFFFFKSDTTTLESVADSDETTQTPKQERKNTGRLLIILAGSAVSLALILIIIHELYAYHHMSHPIGGNHVENDVYEDIAADNNQRLLRCLWYQTKAKEFEYRWQTLLNHLNHIHM